MRKTQKYKEEELYNPVCKYLKNTFIKHFKNCHLEVTSRGVFSEKLKEEVSGHNQLLFYFINKRNSPDLTGYLTIFNPVKKYVDITLGATHNEFITTEIKTNKLKLKDVCQARRYGLLFRAKYTFLLSLKPVPTEIKRLANTTNLLSIEDNDFVLGFKSGVRIAQFSINETTGE